MSTIGNIEQDVKTELTKIETYSKSEVDALIAGVKTKTIAVSYWVFPIIAVGGYIAISLALVLLKHFV